VFGDVYLLAEIFEILINDCPEEGSILCVEDALRMLKETNCDALMIGRGSVIHPFIFHEIKAYFSGINYSRSWENLNRYLNVYLGEIAPEMPMRIKINKMKQLFGFLFKGNQKLLELRKVMLTSSYTDLDSFLSFAIPLLQENFIN
jgi:tRNA-dihydrouridine synthase C